MQQFSIPPIVHSPVTGSLTDAIVLHAAHQPFTVSIVQRKGSQWIDFTSAEFLELVRQIAKGLRACGIQPGDRVGIIGRTCFEWTVTDYAIWFAGAVTVPVYETSSAEQVKWILGDSGAVAVLVEKQRHLDVVNSVRTDLPALRHTWVFENGAFDELRAVGSSVSDTDIESVRSSVTPKDVATIIYTSGTTGQPKGCVVTHGNLMFLVRNIIPAAPEIFGQKETSTLLFLPLAHVFGRIIEIAMVESGLKVSFAPDVKDLVADLGHTQPSFLLAVPRVFEKVFNSAQQKATTEGKEKIFNAAAAVAIGYSKAIQDGHVPASLRIKHALFDKLVYGKLRAAMGGKVTWSVSGGAALGSRLGHFYRGIGLTILEGYGLTETSSASTVNLPNFIRVGSVGRPIPGVTVLIADDGEILVKGDHIFQGYWHNDKATAEAIDSQGWFHTGDVGHLDDDGYLFITGRKKELLVTSGGKNVAPAVLEDRLRANWLVSQCMVVGDAKPFIGCLVTIDSDSLKQWLERNHRPATTTVTQLRNDAAFIAEIQGAVDYANKAVSQAESIRKFVLIDSDWSEDSGHLTPSLKLRRNVVSSQFSAEIESIYAN